MRDSPTGLPEIPSIPISASEAKNLLSKLKDGQKDNTPSDWYGWLNEANYNINASLDSETMVELEINVENKRMNITNVIAVIRGSVEPDRYVIVGNHHDAWMYGAMDPSGGTAIVQEMARSFITVMKKEKWRPRRTILFCHWGGEEYGLMGSVEWVQEYAKNLKTRTVVYINMDTPVIGNHTLDVASILGLKEAIYKSTQQISNPNQTEIDLGRKTVYDTWLARTSEKANKTLEKPSIEYLGSGSDFSAFVHPLGIPALDLRYIHDEGWYRQSWYPLYHTRYETFYLVDKLVDPEYKYHKAVASVVLNVILLFAESPIIPVDFDEYSKETEKLVQQFQEKYKADISNEPVLRKRLKYFEKQSNQFVEETRKFAARLSEFKTQNPQDISPIELRMLNDQIMYLDRAFTEDGGLPGRSHVKYHFLAPSRENAYDGTIFPGIVDSIYEYKTQSTEVLNVSRKLEMMKTIESSINMMAYLMNSASTTLKDVSDFMDRK